MSRFAAAYKLIDAKEKVRIETAHHEKGPLAQSALKKYETAVSEGNKAREQYIQFYKMLLAAHENLEVLKKETKKKKKQVFKLVFSSSQD